MTLTSRLGLLSITHPLMLVITRVAMSMLAPPEGEVTGVVVLVLPIVGTEVEVVGAGEEVLEVVIVVGVDIITLQVPLLQLPKRALRAPPNLIRKVSTLLLNLSLMLGLEAFSRQQQLCS